jgi:hypothetical protein
MTEQISVERDETIFLQSYQRNLHLYLEVPLDLWVLDILVSLVNLMDQGILVRLLDQWDR